MRTTLLSRLVIVARACLPLQAHGEKAPRSLDELRENKLVVMGTIKQIRVATEGSQFEPAAGNKDWASHVMLDVEQVEKGELTEQENQVMSEPGRV